MTPHQDAETRRNKTEFTEWLFRQDYKINRRGTGARPIIWLAISHSIAASELVRCRLTACDIRCANAPDSSDSIGL